jgi:hypothetical protein
MALNALARPQLVALAKYHGLNAGGTKLQLAERLEAAGVTADAIQDECDLVTADGSDPGDEADVPSDEADVPGDEADVPAGRMAHTLRVEFDIPRCDLTTMAHTACIAAAEDAARSVGRTPRGAYRIPECDPVVYAVSLSRRDSI